MRLAPRTLLAAALATAAPATLAAQTEGLSGIGGKPAEIRCSMCADWTVPHPPVRLHGGTWYVGMRTLSALLVTSPQGHILLDGGLPDASAYEPAADDVLARYVRDDAAP